MSALPLLTVVPTRGRPQNARALRQAYAETGARSKLVFCVDDDDPELAGYEQRGTIVGVGRRRLGTWLNEYAPAACESPGLEVIGFMGDDHRPRTPGWDAAVHEAVARTPFAVVYGNDLVHGEALPTACWLDARIVRELGYMVPPRLVHLFMDNFWRDLGRALGTLCYLPDVIIEHVHPLVGKAPTDAGYAEADSPETWRVDEETYRDYVVSGGLVRAVSMLRGE